MWGTEKKADRRPDDENFTFLARGASFKGIASFDGTIRLDGRFEGELQAKGNLIIGEQAIVKGVVTATTVILGGKLNGTITGSERVKILKSAVMIGDIRTPALSMDEGAHFHGHAEMGADRWIEDELTASQPPENVHDLVAHREKLRVQELPS